MYQFTPKTKIESAKINANFAEVVASASFSGEVRMFAGASGAVPSGWLLCDGSAVSRTAYAQLFAIIGTAFGIGDGSTTFNLPDMKGRAVFGYDSGQTEFNALGKNGGEKAHVLSTNEMPSHNHTITDGAGSHNHGGNTGNYGSNKNGSNTCASGSSKSDATSNNHNHSISTDGAHNHAINNNGGGLAHNNLPTYLTMNFIIKA